MTRVTLVLVLFAALGAGTWYFTRPHPVAVVLHTVARGQVTATVSNTRVGTIKACRRAGLSPATGGQVALLTVAAGDRVDRNAVLLEVWNEDLKAELRHAEAEVAAARARAQAACSTAAGAEREAARLRRLSADRLVSENAVDVAVTEAESHRAECTAATAATQVSSARVVVTQRAIEKTVLRAPFAGIAAEVNAELGEYITPSPPGIATLPAIDLLESGCVYVSAPIDEVDAPEIRAGMSACVTLDAFSGRRCGARVRRIAPYVLEREKQARTVEVEVAFTDPVDPGALLPGYSADIEILLEEHPADLRVPTEAIIEGPAVLVYDAASGRLVHRAIATGIANWEFTEVTRGLAAGDRIVLSVGREGVTEGADAVPENATDE